MEKLKCLAVKDIILIGIEIQTVCVCMSMCVCWRACACVGVFACAHAPIAFDILLI